MNATLTRQELDYMASHRFRDGRPHPPGEDEIVIKGACHGAAPADLMLDGANLIICCSECGSWVADVALAGPLDALADALDEHDCPAWAWYRYHSGMLRIVCDGCDENIAMVPVAGAELN